MVEIDQQGLLQARVGEGLARHPQVSRVMGKNHRFLSSLGHLPRDEGRSRGSWQGSLEPC